LVWHKFKNNGGFIMRFFLLSCVLTSISALADGQKHSPQKIEEILIYGFDGIFDHAGCSLDDVDRVILSDSNATEQETREVVEALKHALYIITQTDDGEKRERKKVEIQLKGLREALQSGTDIRPYLVGAGFGILASMALHVFFKEANEK
jgi:hypothetical protein